MHQMPPLPTRSLRRPRHVCDLLNLAPSLNLRIGSSHASNASPRGLTGLAICQRFSNALADGLFNLDTELHGRLLGRRRMAASTV
jgi:hypothetical protein